MCDGRALSRYSKCQTTQLRIARAERLEGDPNGLARQDHTDQRKDMLQIWRFAQLPFDDVIQYVMVILVYRFADATHPEHAHTETAPRDGCPQGPQSTPASRVFHLLPQ